MDNIKVLCICGSLRRGSNNLKLLNIAKEIAFNQGCVVSDLDLSSHLLPLYDPDIGLEGLPEDVEEAKKLVKNSDIMLIASPQDNQSISAALKNLLDWLAFRENSLNNKVAAIFGASINEFGTFSSQEDLRKILTELKVYIIPKPFISVNHSANAFNSDGSLKSYKTYQNLEELVNKTINFCEALSEGFLEDQ